MKRSISKRAYLVCILCCNFIAFVSANSENRADEMCRQFSDLYMRQCSSRDAPPRPRNVILRGKQGLTGARGPPGPPGPVNYRQIDKKLAAANLGLEAKFDEKLSRLEEKLGSRILALETTPKTTETPQETTIRGCSIDDEDCEGSGGHGCELQYNGKCFLAIIHNYQDVDFAEAKTLCSDIGWNLANLYSKEHYDRVASYLRTKLSSSGYISTWLGLTYQFWRRINLSSGRQLRENLPWYPGYPANSYRNLNIFIRRDPNSRNQGISNIWSVIKANGALCEISASDLRDD